MVRSINQEQNVARLSSLPGDIRRSSMANLRYRNSKRNVTTSMLPNIDTKLYHQAELMIRSSMESLRYSQHPSEAIDNPHNHRNEIEEPETA